MPISAIESATDSTQLLALMGGGGLLAALGFWLMLWTGPGGESARIALGSLHVPATAAGFTLFLGGMATFSAPVVAPGGTHAMLAQIAPAVFAPGAGTEQFELAAGHPGSGGSAEEAAVALTSGALVGGTHGGGSIDWFRLDTAGLEESRIEVAISERASGCRAHAFDSEMNRLGARRLGPGENRMTLDVSGNREIFMQLLCDRKTAAGSYTITFAPKRG
ncbi:hypothetical protein [Rhodobacteraceae bacterium DSL-40]|uniref:hypothetical protein n=1 Tax=Amaricoccus sp. B4 TaxID=3368557 RepID=UPI000DAC6F8B